MNNIDSPGRALFQFVRFWSRRWTGVGTAVEPERGRDVMVTEAVLARSGAAATINEIADELGIDQSGASRMVTQAAGRGYLVKSIAPDARTRLVSATKQGRALVAQAHAWQDDVFAKLTSDWTPDEIRQFTTLMKRLTAAHNAR